MGQTADEGNRRAEDEVRFTRTERKYRPLDGGHPDVQLVRVCQELRPRHALDRRLPRHVAQPYAGDVERDAHQQPHARHDRLQPAAVRPAAGPGLLPAGLKRAERATEPQTKPNIGRVFVRTANKC
jgi:hypothetical protein